MGIQVPEANAIESRALALDEMGKIVVRSVDGYTDAGEKAIVVQNEVRSIQEIFSQDVTLLIVPKSDQNFRVARLDGPLDAVAFRAHKDILAARDGMIERPKGILARIKASMTGWAVKEQEERERKRREAQAEADRLAKIENDRKAKEAEAAAREAKRDGDKVLAAALKAEAEQIKAAPVVAAPVHVESKRPVLAGVAMRQQKTGEVTDPVATVRYLAEHPEMIPAAIQFRAAWVASIAKSGLPVPGIAVSVKTIAAVGCRQRESDDQNGGHLPDME